MAEAVLRVSENDSCELLESNSVCETAIDYTGFTSGVVIVPSSFSGAAIAFEIGGAPDAEDWSVLVIADGSPDAVTIASVPCAVPLPAGLAGAPWFKIFSDTQQSGGIVFYVYKKS